jgi:Protein of unknown function (DUF2934)
MATRRIDLERSGSRAAQPSGEGTPNTITSHSLERRSGGQGSSVDPSPFSRPASADDIAERHERIALAAYLRAEARGFEPGHELEDWLAAEQEIDGDTSDFGNRPA